ncbi:uncharacterized protein LOC132724546 [Ruditapes philippinarum]|uniref:uncharacterized protein LOC132724546 n=1 Tax=Ruditapes philippinarum TaxID=129788 RepID=UPI00295B549F|nr:uncharacterized protein LOC132724546 [Ruditapes philippinarum]
MAVPGKKASKQFLLSTTSKASDEDLQDNCQHCDDEGTKVPAHEYCSYCKEHLCENCFINHKKHKRFKQDTLSVALSMPKSLQQTTTSTCTTLLYDRTTSCQEHNSKPNEAISTKKATKSLAIVKQKTLTDSQSGQINPRQFSFQGEICVKTSKDSGFHKPCWIKRCWITGMTLLTPDVLIITDYNNRAVKMVDTRSQSITDQLQLGTQPWDITKITSTELAVTLYRQHEILFISVASKKLSTERSLKVDGDCNGISYFQAKLVVSISKPAKLQILDMNGTTLTTIDGKANGIFENPIYVTTNISSIYVSDYDLKTVTRLNWQGDVISTYSMTKNRGMSLSDDGTVFVCDKEKNVIDVISGDCSTGKVVLQDRTNPHAVCWCGETNKLYYSCDPRQAHFNDFLHIYKLS